MPSHPEGSRRVQYDYSPDAGLSVRGSRVCIVTTEDQYVLANSMSSLGIPVFSPMQFDDLVVKHLLYFDIVAFVGDPDLISSVDTLSDVTGKKRIETRIAFVPEALYERAKGFLKFSDAVVHCAMPRSKALRLIAVSEGNSSEVCNKVIYHFFQSLVLPSMLNIDVSDVRNIARGIGIAFMDSSETTGDIIDRLPEACSNARSGLLHFTCSKGVTLSEVYSISKAVAKKRSDKLAALLAQDGNPQQKKVFRKMNVKMGIRISQEYGPRIRLTAILFGIERRYLPFDF